MKRIGVLVSGGGTNLQALIDAQKDGSLKSGRIELVLSNKVDAFALHRAQLARIPTAIVTKEQYPEKEAFEQAILARLMEYRIDLVVLAGFMSVLSPEFVAHYPRAMINIHPSLIPSFCGEGFYGLRVHRAAIERGVKVSGATVHYVNEIVDGGEIIAQKALAVRKGETPESLQRRVLENCEWAILPRAVEKVCREMESGQTEEDG